MFNQLRGGQDNSTSTVVLSAQSIETNTFSRETTTRLQLVGATYGWVTCFFVAGMIISQFFGVIASSVDEFETTKYGRDPALGLYSTGMTNDVPYADRVLVCTLSHNVYEPVQLSELLDSPKASAMTSNDPTAGSAGYRVVERNGLALDSTAYNIYSHACGVAAKTMDSIFNVCRAFEYNASEDLLRVVPGVNNETVIEISDTLPLLILPYWDNAPAARFVMPTWDGSACNIRLMGNYMDPTSSESLVSGTNRSTYESKTVEWVGRRDGQWRHGWYEDDVGDKWYSFTVTSIPGAYGLPRVTYFDAQSSKEVCKVSSTCDQEVRVSIWGPCQ